MLSFRHDPEIRAFDLEIAKTVPETAPTWDPYYPLGITCAAVALEGEAEPRIWRGHPQMTQPEVEAMLEALQQFVRDGYTLLTWNGCKFDFRMLGEETGRWAEAAALAAEHVDLMLMFTFQQGHFLALDRALKGAGLHGKRKSVRLNSGEMLEEMHGAKAPQLWAAGEIEAVLSYLRDDTTQLIPLARTIEATKRMRWVTKSGAIQEARFDRVYTVRECFRLPAPTGSWMGNPAKREMFFDWMPGKKLPGS